MSDALADCRRRLCGPADGAARSAGQRQRSRLDELGGGPQNLRYRPFDQIDASNFSQLEVAWRFKTDSLGNLAPDKSSKERR